MIVFVSAHDLQTRANHAIASHIHDDDDMFIDAENATRERLNAALRSSDAPLFAMSHGEFDKLLAQGGRDTPAALSVAATEDLSLLRGRPVFAHACSTGKILGRHASVQGSIWWGYEHPVSAPDEDPELLSIFVGVFTFIKSAFVGAKTKDERRCFFVELHQRCQNAAEQLTDIHDKCDHPPLPWTPRIWR